MRYSFDTDRTQVELPTREGSEEHLDILTEKRTMENQHDQDLYEEKPQPQGIFSASQRHQQTNEDDSSSSNEEKDLEQGDYDPDEAEKAEELRRQKEEMAKDPNLVEWDGLDDPGNPMNWKTSKKWTVTIMLGFMTFCVTFASSVFSNATVPTAEEFGVSTEVTTLGTSLFVLGFGVGPLVWGPGSELFGRKLPLFFGYACFAIFQCVHTFFFNCLADGDAFLISMPAMLTLSFPLEFQLPLRLTFKQSWSAVSLVEPLHLRHLRLLVEHWPTSGGP